MKVLWLGGIVLPRIAEKEHLNVVYMNGGLIQLSETLGKNGLELVYVFDSKKRIIGKTDYYSYYSIVGRNTSTRKLRDNYVNQAEEIIRLKQLLADKGVEA